nr:ribonuclease H-like domain-containing protein [Tanacetum cinerariifolium]
LNAIWKQFDALIELPRCTCHAADDFKKHNHLMNLMQFLLGLDDTHMEIRNSILSRETLPNVRIAYAIIYSEESLRVASGLRPLQVSPDLLMITDNVPPLRFEGLLFELEWDLLLNYTIRPSNSFEWRKFIFEMITSMRIRHAKAYTLRGWLID